MALDSAQLNYMSKVLGVKWLPDQVEESLILPAEESAEQIHIAGDAEDTFQVTGKASAKVLFVLPNKNQLFEKGDEASTLMKKMIQAMKIQPVALAKNLNLEGSVCAARLAKLIEDQKPQTLVVLSTQENYQNEIEIDLSWGERGVVNGIPTWCTWNPLRLMSETQLKKETWNTLQEVMKELANA